MRCRRVHVHLPFLLLIATGVAPSTVVAQDDATIAEARAHFERAERHDADGDVALALRAFEQSHALLVRAGHPNAPLVLYNIARCYAALGRDAEAIDAFERFLAESGADAPNREVAQAQVRELRARQAIRSEDDGDDGGGGISPVGPIVAAVGGAIVIAGAVTGGLALAAEADATEGCVDGRCPPELADRADEAHLLANVTDGLLFGGLAVATVGIVLTFVLPGDSEATVETACTTTGCTATGRVRF